MAKTLKIKLTGLRVYANHGVFDFERQNGQDFYIDASVWVDKASLELSDDLSKTVSYADLAKALVDDVKTQPVDLLETLAQRLVDLVLNWGGPAGRVVKAKVTVHKPNAPIGYEFQDVSVTAKGKRKAEGN